jgi:hypothetical protein
LRELLVVVVGHRHVHVGGLDGSAGVGAEDVDLPDQV